MNRTCLRRATLLLATMIAPALPSIAGAYGYPSGPVYFGSRTDYIDASVATNSDGWGDVIPTFLDAGYEIAATTQTFVCGLAGIGGQFESGGDYPAYVALYAINGEVWYLRVQGRGTSGFLNTHTDHGSAWGGIRCVPFTHFAGYDPTRAVQVTTADAGPNSSSSLLPYRFVTTFMGFFGALDGGGEKATVEQGPGNIARVRYDAAGQAARDGVVASGASYNWGEPPNGSYRSYKSRFHWDQYQQEPTTRLIPVDQGVCFLAGVSGKFRGYGEHVEVVEMADGYWHLTGASQQSEVQGWAECFRYDG